MKDAQVKRIVIKDDKVKVQLSIPLLGVRLAPTALNNQKKETYEQLVITGDLVAGLRALFGVTNQDYFTRDRPRSK